ncbi:hypothetical protein OIU77_026930 [Salix suchowensis]|uniref:Uncharacterized protein n=1 Tax=Salix suchowensis TaxID=1278906 RepID=A0ABQ9BMR3_9ROSI|nr:hypothetical protein OIU77_026930 [Salix suchowensis]
MIHDPPLLIGLQTANQLLLHCRSKGEKVA